MESDSGISRSVWMSEPEIDSDGQMTSNTEADVAIVGAGISGLTTAFLLASEGKSVIVIDDGAIGGGMTSRTTAHLANALDDRYFELERLHGENGARLAAESHSAATDQIESIVASEGIDCEFERVDGYLFTGMDVPAGNIDKEFAASLRARVAGIEIVERAPVDGFETGRCLRFPDQAQFHPIKYLDGLARAIRRKGGRIFTRTHVADVRSGTPCELEIEGGGVVRAGSVVVATNSPINNRFVTHTKQAPYMTYVIGVKALRGSVPRILLWDMEDPYHYVRVTDHPDDGKSELLIVGGEDHKTGHADNEASRFARLEAWTRERFASISDVEFRWSGQVMEPVDGLAFIGRNPLDKDNIYIATGDSGNGMTHGTIAGMLIRDLIMGRTNPWEAIYDPSRKSLRSLGEFAKENLNVAGQYADLVTAGEIADVDEIGPGEGAVIRDGFKKLAIYRDEAGQIHRRSAVCVHLGCIVDWNSFEKTWDCPCHGSRFDAYGKVFQGPANSDLPPVEIDSEQPGESE